MDINWAAVLGGVALVGLGSERVLAALLPSKSLPRVFDALTTRSHRALAFGIGLASLAPGSDRLRSLPGALVRTGRLETASAASMRAGTAWAALLAFALVALAFPLGSLSVLAALAVGGLGFLLSRVGRRAAALADVLSAWACTLGGAAAISIGFTALALSPIELPWSWTAQLCASFAVGCLALLALRSEGLVAALSTGAALSGSLDPYSAFSAMLGANATGAALLALRESPPGARWWSRDSLVVDTATTLFGCFALAWTVLFGARLPASLQQPVWLLGSLLGLVVVAHTALSMVYARWRGAGTEELRGEPRPSDVGLAPLLAWEGALASMRYTSSIVRGLVTTRLKGAVVDAAEMRRCLREAELMTGDVTRIGCAAREAEVPGWLGGALRGLEESGHRQVEVIAATSRLTAELSDERGLGSFASRVRQAKLSVINFVEGCDDFVQARAFELPNAEHQAVRARLATVREVVLSATSTQNPYLANKILEDVHHLGTILDLELAACTGIAALEHRAGLDRVGPCDASVADGGLEPQIEVGLASQPVVTEATAVVR